MYLARTFSDGCLRKILTFKEKETTRVMLPHHKRQQHLLQESANFEEKLGLTADGSSGVFEADLKSTTQIMDNISLMDKIHPSLRALRFEMITNILVHF